jgi:hypothetical protein
MSPHRYIMCKELIRTAAEAKAEKAAAASILVDMSMNTASESASCPGAAVAKATATVTTKTTMPDSIDPDKSIRALCAAARLVRSTTLRFAGLRPFHYGGRRHVEEEDAAAAALVEGPESVAVLAAVSEPNCSAYKHRHSWRRRRLNNVPTVVEEARVENVPEPGPARGDAPAGCCAAYKYRHSWRRRRRIAVRAVVGAAGSSDEDAPVTTEEKEDRGGAVRSAGRQPCAATRVRVVVAGAFVGVCEAARVVAESSSFDNGDDDEVPSLVQVEHVTVAVLPLLEAPDTGRVAVAAREDMVPPPRLVVEPIREGWQERQKRRGRGERYAAILAAVLPTQRRQRRSGGGGIHRRA